MNTLMQEASMLLRTMPRGTMAELSRRTGLSNRRIKQIADGIRLTGIGPHPSGDTSRVITGRQMLQKALIELRKMRSEADATCLTPACPPVPQPSSCNRT